MIFFKTILVAADFSKNSQEAFRLACALAREGETRLVVLHVAEPAYIPEEPVYFSQPTVHFSAVARDPADIESIRQRLREFYVPDRPIETEHRTEEGLPEETILRTADEVGCNLIVMGTHGRTGLARLLMGSVAEAVLRRSSCPVLTLKSSVEVEREVPAAEHSPAVTPVHPKPSAKPTPTSPTQPAHNHVDRMRPRGGHISTLTVDVEAEQLREAEASRRAHSASPSSRERMVDIGRGNQQSGRQSS